MHSFHSSTFRSHTPFRQRGIALGIALMFLLILTILGVSALSTSTLQEKMTGNLKDKHWSFHSAESGVMQGEDKLCTYWVGRIPAIDPTDTADGLHRTSSSGEPIWKNSALWSGNDLFTHPFNFDESRRADVPKYIIEEVQEVRENLKAAGEYSRRGSTRMLYRVTARGVGGTANASTVLQSTFAKK